MTEEEKLELPPYTHKTSITVYSKDNDKEVWVAFDFEPEMSGVEVASLGYMPAAYGFMEEFLVPAVEEGFFQMTGGVLGLIDPPTDAIN